MFVLNQVGRVSPSTTLDKLEQNTLYFIRVGTWDDPEVHLYKNLSEIIMVTTMGEPSSGMTLYNS